MLPIEFPRSEKYRSQVSGDLVQDYWIQRMTHHVVCGHRSLWRVRGGFGAQHFSVETPEKWPEAEIGELPKDDPEVENEKPIFLLKISHKLQTLLQRYSSWTLLQRRVAWLVKFVSYLQCHKAKNLYQGSKYLTAADLEKATIAIVKLIQREVYPNEVKIWKMGELWNVQVRLLSFVHYWMMVYWGCPMILVNHSLPPETSSCRPKPHPCTIERKVLDARREVCSA